ncbi:MAG: MBL fold metallo-hydrolase [Longimicrobiales bacterium]
MRLTFLGTGTSFGVPVIGCTCATCTSDDPRDKRTRHGALVELPECRLLIDTPPELRLQLLRAEVSQVDAVFFTHLHADHIHGLDDVRIFSTKGRGAVPAYVTQEMREDLVARFNYIFDPKAKVPMGTTKPRIDLHDYEAGVPLHLLGADLLPFRVPHGPTDAFGFRTKGLGYVTDACELPGPALEALRGVEVLVLNALWWGNPHPTHFNVEQAIAAAEQVGAARTYLTHLTHRVDYESLASRLPAGIEPAYDGLTVDVG